MCSPCNSKIQRTLSGRFITPISRRMGIPISRYVPLGGHEGVEPTRKCLFSSLGNLIVLIAQPTLLAQKQKAPTRHEEKALGEHYRLHRTPLPLLVSPLCAG